MFEPLVDGGLAALVSAQGAAAAVAGRLEGIGFGLFAAPLRHLENSCPRMFEPLVDEGLAALLRSNAESPPIFADHLYLQRLLHWLCTEKPGLYISCVYLH